MIATHCVRLFAYVYNRGRTTAWSAVQDRLKEWDGVGQDILGYIASPAFVIPLLIVLVVVTIFYFVSLQTARKEVALTSKKIKEHEEAKKKLLKKLKGNLGKKSQQ
eukprot:m.106327 g.106327  ORF g.106327 m.106327 type:complete len:106 (+) comp12672_c1_seq1:2743-3060(+)